MEALVFDGELLSLKYHKLYPIPKISNDDEVIVRVEYTGVCGTDLQIIQGDFPVRIDRPIILGHEFSGFIYAVGKNSIFKVGQRVSVDPNSGCQLCDFCRSGKYQNCLTASINSYIGIFKDGGWAKYCKVPQQQVYALPDGITTMQACLAEPFSCVAHCFNRAAPLKIGEKILIIGAGIIGNLFASALHHHGHRKVTISEKNEKRLSIVKRMDTGFRLVNPDILAQEKMLYDVIFDCTGVTEVMETSIGYMQQGGRYIIFGCCPPADRASINLYQIFDKEITIIGVKTNSFSFHTAMEWLRVMGGRYVDYHKLGVKAYWLEEFEAALADVRTGRVSKIVFKISPHPNM